MSALSPPISAPRGQLFRVHLCLLLLCFSAFSLLHQQSISPVHALEEDEYSVASLLPSFKTLLFWRAADEKKIPLAEENLNRVSYQVSETQDSPNNKAPTTTTTITTTKLETTKLPTLPDTSSFGFANFQTNSADLIKQTKTFAFNNKKQRLINGGNSKDNRICHSCSKNDFFFDDEDEEYRQRIEYIKELILTRLGMKRPPLLLTQPDIDYSKYMRIAENTLRDLSDIGYQTKNTESEVVEEVDRIFVLPNRNDPRAPLFDLSTVDTSDGFKVIKSIFIMVNYNLTEYYYHTLMHDDTDLFITLEPEENDISRGLEVLSTVSPMKATSQELEETSHFDSAHWYQYDVTSLLTDYTGKEIRIHNENFDILSSVIVIEMTSNKFTRAKRSIDCTDKVSFCCRQHFYVNFTTIGWNNWIFQPPGYNANYCKGKCDLSHARYHHTTVIGKYPAIKLCCSPREMSSISLIYMDDKFNIYQKNLPNMVVESCDCA